MVDEVIDYGIELGYDCTDIVTIHSIDNEGHLSMFDRAWYSDDKCSILGNLILLWGAAVLIGLVGDAVVPVSDRLDLG